MFEDELIADDAEEVTVDELTDLAFGMFTIFVENYLEKDGRYLFTSIDAGEDLLLDIARLADEFEKEYPVLAEPLQMFGSPEDIISFYRFGEAIIPSKTTHTYWIQQSKPETSADACGAEAAGKWLIFLPAADIDNAWRKVRDATVRGELGIGAKVSTARDAENARDDKRVIYVFTENWEDEEDVMRVREKLKELGFVDRIGYKRNLDTYAGEYREKGKRVTYYSV